MTRNVFATVLLVAVAGIMTACATAPNSPAEREELADRAVQTKEAFLANDPSLQELFDDAHAYAIFPSIGRGGAGVGGAYGRGVVYEGGELIGYCDVSQGTIGLQLGGQSFRQLVFFRNAEALDRFKYGDLELSAQATAVAATTGASTDVDYDHGVMIFTMTGGGLMYEASVGGQRFTYQAK